MGGTENVVDIDGASSSVVSTSPFVNPNYPKKEVVQYSLHSCYHLEYAIRDLIPPYIS